jgi:hypothetical protein
MPLASRSDCLAVFSEAIKTLIEFRWASGMGASDSGCCGARCLRLEGLSQDGIRSFLSGFVSGASSHRLLSLVLKRWSIAFFAGMSNAQ